jgi:hypothetical protein
MVAKGIYDDLMFTPNGVAGVFALYANPKASLGNVFLTEFVAVSDGLFLATNLLFLYSIYE